MRKGLITEAWRKKKEAYPSVIILLYGSGYLMTYHEDAETVSKELNLVLVKTELEAPLTGFSASLARENIRKLLLKGYSVGIGWGGYLPQNKKEEQEQEELRNLQI